MQALLIRGILLTGLALVLGSCVMERTVTDGSGEVIYQDTEVHSPFESDAERNAEVLKKERELGW